jgi:hypothetical protein
MLWGSLANAHCSRDFSSFSIAHASKTQRKVRAALLFFCQVLHFNIESGKQIRISKFKLLKLLGVYPAV